VGGNSMNPGSTVTGNIDEGSLAESGSTSKVGASGAKISLSGAGNPKSDSTVTAAPRGPAAKARAEREATAKSFGSNLGPVASGDNHAETLELAALVSNGDDANRAPASADANPEAKPAKSKQAASAKDNSAWDTGVAGSCHDNDKCAGKPIPAVRASECPATHRYFLQSVPGGVCQKLPAK
jgi:hypothetical protein